jgi:hypothetical protein
MNKPAAQVITDKIEAGLEPTGEEIKAAFLERHTEQAGLSDVAQSVIGRANVALFGPAYDYVESELKGVGTDDPMPVLHTFLGLVDVFFDFMVRIDKISGGILLDDVAIDLLVANLRREAQESRAQMGVTSNKNEDREYSV